MPHLSVSGVRLYYEDHGSGQAILCIHGTSSSALAWGAASDELAQLGRVIVYDRRGCFRSERPHPYDVTNVREHADDAWRLLRALAAEPAIVVGRSYGGSVALDLGLRHPESVRALVLLEASPAGLSIDADAWSADIAADVERVAAEQGLAAVGEAFIRRVLGEWESVPEPLREMFSANGPAILAELRGDEHVSGPDQLAELDVPTLLVSASESPRAFQELTAALAAAIPGAKVVRVGGGHMVNPADPAVLAFIAEVLASRG
jgi:pimeloyl-ACP methyl ester carboxylesterase